MGAPDTPAVGAAPARGLQILVVEDHVEGAEALARVLRLAGHNVQTAGDGPAALELARARPPDVALLDIGLPGMNGWEVAVALRAVSAERRPLLMAVTGYGAEGDRRHSEEAGLDGHLVKPVDPEQLLGLLERFRGLVVTR